MNTGYSAPATAGVLLLLALAPACAQGNDESEQPKLFRLSDLARSLSKNPEVRDRIVRRLGKNPAAAGLITPAQKRLLRAAIQRGDWAFLDRFPTLTVTEMGTAVRVADAARTQRKPAKQSGDGVGNPPVGLQRVVELLGIPSGGQPPGDRIRDLGAGLQQGNEKDPERAKRYADSARLAEVLNRLARNDPKNENAERYELFVDGNQVRNPEFLLNLLRRSGHTVEVRDARYFADFGDLSYKGQPVAAPFWADTELKVPGTDRNLLVPASHSQHELTIRGPAVNADVVFFFGIDGNATFRPSASKRAAWSAGTVKHVYKGDDAVEAVRIAGEIHKAFAAKKAAHPDLPYGGYFALGVCNDSNALIELHMTGKTTLYPLTRDLTYFPSDSEVDVLARKLPVDGKGEPDLNRILGSLPVDDLSDLPFPSVRADLRRILDAKGRKGLTKLDELMDKDR